MRTVNYQFVPFIVRWLIIATAIVLALLIASVAAACPNCKEGLAQNDPHGQSIAAGYYYSILFMMSMPFAILGTFGSLAYLSIRRARQQAEAQQQDESQVGGPLSSDA
jgi:ABC-type Na+ efflux pump permease subunit